MSDVRLPLGAVALRITLYDVESHGGAAAPDEGEVALSAAVTALATRMKHRLELIAWCAEALEEIGWELALDGDVVLASKVTLPEIAVEELEDHGIWGPLTHVCELDARGFPRLVERWERV